MPDARIAPEAIPRVRSRPPVRPPAGGLRAGDAGWLGALAAVDRTCADLAACQERLGRQNHEFEDLRFFVGSILSGLSDALIGPEGRAPLEPSVSPRLDDRGRVMGYVVTGRRIVDMLVGEQLPRIC